MIIELTSSAVVGAIAGYSYLKQKGTPTNDVAKIQRIFENANLTPGNERIRLFRKRKHPDCTEYVFQFPQGRSFKQLLAQKDVIEDGLNVRYSQVELRDLLALDWRHNVIKQVRELFRDKKTPRKEVELDFDGMLRIRVYDEPLAAKVPWTDDLLRKDWRVPVGKSRKGFVYHDFEDRAHMIVAGATGFGKSQYLKLLITALIAQQPEHVSFSLVDLKGGTAFQRFRRVRQTVNFATNPTEATDALRNVQSEMDAKLSSLVAAGHEDTAEANDKHRHFVIIDEAADLDADSRDIVTDIARRGRAAGYRLVYATQYPTNETLPSQVRQNIGARVCFVLETNRASLAALDDSGAETLPDIPGRAIYKKLRKEIVQCPFITNEAIAETIRPHLRKEAQTSDANVTQARTPHRSDPIVISPTRLS